MEPISRSPDNPYDSFLIEASAGSGKTYQLSQRYLKLVAAGAEPKKILTITFTVKAASEMRTRILQEALKLSHDDAYREDFDLQMRGFYETQKLSYAPIRKPLSAEQVAATILSATQSLKITTIDSIFWEWVRRFAFDLVSSSSDGAPQELKLLSKIELLQENKKTWSRIFKDLENGIENTVLVNQAFAVLNSIIPDEGALQIASKAEELDRFETYIWDQINEHGNALYSYVNLSNLEIPEVDSLLKGLENEFLKVMELSKNFEVMVQSFREAIASSSFIPLQKTRVLTQELTISGASFRGKKRETRQDEIACIESTLQEFNEKISLRNLQLMGMSFMTLYNHFSSIRQEIKGFSGSLVFSDLTKGCSRLFQDLDLVGSVWAVMQSVDHLLLDEFQDTSLLQWKIFQKLGIELLSGSDTSDSTGGLGSVFIVGDAKQSIYGFREAAPEVMQYASESLSAFNLKVLPLNKSFRTSQVILDFVNEYFTNHYDEGFPRHETAVIRDNTFVADMGSLELFPIFEESDSLRAVEVEAKQIADKISKILAPDSAYAKYDRGQKQFKKIGPKDICILYRDSTNADIYQSAIKEKNIPVRKFEEKGFFKSELIQDITALMTFLAGKGDSVELLQWIRSGFIGVSNSELSTLLELSRIAGPKGVATVDATKLLKHFASIDFEASQKINDILKEVNQLTPFQLLSSIVFDFSLLPKIDCFENWSSLEKEEAKRNVLKLLEIASDAEKAGVYLVGEFLDQLIQMEKMDETGPAVPGGECVQMMTVHKSKGLEFACVFIVGLGDKPWYSLDRYWTKYKKLDDSVGGGFQNLLAYTGTTKQQPKTSAVFDKIRDLQQQDLIDEARRLLYVAMTRASHHLVFSGHKTKAKEDKSFYLEVKDSFEKLNAVTSGDSLVLTRGLDISAELWADSKVSSLDNKKLVSSNDLNTNELFPPEQVEIVRPHSLSEATKGNEGQYYQLIRDPIRQKFAIQIGLFVHKLLEDAIFDWFKHEDSSLRGYSTEQLNGYWKLFRGKEAINYEEEKLAFQFACETWEKNRCSEVLIGLLKNAVQIFPEVRVASLSDSELMMGQADLVLENQDGSFLIVDYKTVEFTGDAKSLCIDKGYQGQLKAYCSSLTNFGKVEGAIWLTFSGELVKLI